MIQELEKNKFFKKKILENEEILFDEWDFDQNIYFIKSGKLKVEKYFSSDKKEKKVLALLWEKSIFWEWALSNSNPKEVLISSIEKTELLFIESKNFTDFLKEFPELSIKFLTSIIDLSNKRLLESNFLLTSNYKISELISKTKEFSNKNLFKIILEFQKIIKADYIIFAEVNQVLENFINILYDTREAQKMKNDILEIFDFKIDLKNFEKYNLSEKNLIVELKNGNKIIWFFIIWDEKEKIFSDTIKKSIDSIWVLLASYIKQKQDFQNEKDKEF